MTQSPNEVLARMMGLDPEYICHWCNDVESEKRHKVCNAPDGDGHLYKPQWPDFANDANWAERLAAWLAEREDIAYFYYCWRLKRAVLIINHGTKIFNDTFCAAITAAGLWYNETKGGIE